MTYIVSAGALNSTHSLTTSHSDQEIRFKARDPSEGAGECIHWGSDRAAMRQTGVIYTLQAGKVRCRETIARRHGNLRRGRETQRLGTDWETIQPISQSNQNF